VDCLNIVFLALDTLRADHLGCYGYHKNTTPHIDQLAKRGVLFRSMIAENNVTQSSFVTMLTGRNPVAHGVVNMKPQKISPKLTTMSQILKRNGYRTAAVDNNHRCTGTVNNWFKRGYDDYLDPGEKRKIHFLATAEDVNRLAFQWLKQHRQEKFFLFLHYWDPHFPYIPPQPWNRRYTHNIKAQVSGRDLKTVMREPLYSWFQKWSKGVNNPEYVRGLYDGEISYLDYHIGQLLEQLKELNLLDNTLIVLVGDHGESLGEHHIYFDHHGLYDATVHVPFIMVAPGVLPENKRVDGLCQHADILPTVLHVAGIQYAPPRQLDGKSLVPLIRGKLAHIRPFVTSCEANWQLKRSIRTPKWKLIKSLEQDVYGNPKFELYHLERDADEQHNVAAKRQQVVSRLNRLLEQSVKQLRSKYKAVDPLSKGQKTKLHPLTVAEEEKVKKRLSDLGY
jgi:arylsulfatase A-like enzyme